MRRVTSSPVADSSWMSDRELRRSRAHVADSVRGSRPRVALQARVERPVDPERGGAAGVLGDLARERQRLGDAPGEEVVGLHGADLVELPHFGPGEDRVRGGDGVRERAAFLDCVEAALLHGAGEPRRAVELMDNAIKIANECLSEARTVLAMAKQSQSTISIPASLVPQFEVWGRQTVKLFGELRRRISGKPEWTIITG